MKFFLRFLFIIFITFYAFDKAFAQPSQRGMFWTGFEINGPFAQKSKWHYDFMNQARLTYTQNVLEQYIIRSSLFYQFNQNLSLWAGYDFNPTKLPNNHSYFLEQRVWPQIQYTTIIKEHVDFTLRSRLELRWRSNADGVGLWFRQRAEVGIVKFNKHNIDIDIFDEIFFILAHASWGAQTVVDQNRVFVGLVFPLSTVAAFDLGYLNLYRPNGYPSTMDHVLVTGVEFNLSKGIPLPIETL